jgi:hypothetical protein
MDAAAYCFLPCALPRPGQLSAKHADKFVLIDFPARIAVAARPAIHRQDKSTSLSAAKLQKSSHLLWQ